MVTVYLVSALCAGPWVTAPVILNSLPWHGHLKSLEDESYPTVHCWWVHTRLNATNEAGVLPVAVLTTITLPLVFELPTEVSSVPRLAVRRALPPLLPPLFVGALSDLEHAAKKLTVHIAAVA